MSDIELQEAKRAGDVLKALRLLQRSNKLNYETALEVNATPEHLEELGIEFGNGIYATKLAALYNHARTQGMGFLRFKAEIMTENQAMMLLMLSNRTYFDYLYGRVIKTDLTTTNLRLYDRDNGVGAYSAALTCEGCPRCSK